MGFHGDVKKVLGEPRDIVKEEKKNDNGIRSVAVDRNHYNVLQRVKLRFYPDCSLKDLVEVAIKIAYGSGMKASEDDQPEEE